MGIGAQLDKERQDKKPYGSFLVGRVLSGGPADISGLKEGDRITEIDQLSAQAYWLGTKEEGRGQVLNLLNYFSDKKGRQVNLKVERGSEVLSLSVYCTQIDRVAWVPLDTWLNSSLNMSEANNVVLGGVSVRSKVVEDKSTGKFIYTYRLLNTTKRPVTIQWSTLDIANNNFPNLVYLKSKKQAEFVLTTYEFPIEHFGRLTIFKSIEDEKWLLESDKENGFTTPNKDYWAGISRSGSSGFVPFNRLSQSEE